MWIQYIFSPHSWLHLLVQVLQNHLGYLKLVIAIKGKEMSAYNVFTKRDMWCKNSYYINVLDLTRSFMIHKISFYGVLGNVVQEE